VIVCGHYEGIDARIESVVDEEISLGDFVLTGGEIAAVAVVDAVARLLPGVLGNSASPEEESFSEGLLEYPQFTRPRTWRDQDVPDVLLSGHHGQISAWRLSRSKQRTRERRPDLWRRWLAQQANGVDEHGSDE
jgi:tRNA (guanine37-N1)-methyltransferase